MKDFNDFTKLVPGAMGKKVQALIDGEGNNMERTIAACTQITLNLLEEYHNWVNGD